MVDPGLLPFLLQEGGGGRRWLPLALVALGWTLTVLALANPTWQRLPTPAFRTDAARVLVLDLSASMEAADLKPSRLARARYKVADILKASGDGQVGLVAFAGDAFVVAPLSDDAETLLAMLDALSPQIMPVRGSRPDLGLGKAEELLAAVGARDGEVILVSDDPGDDRALTAAGTLANQGHRVSVLGVGTREGAPVPGARDADGKPVIARLAEPGLEALARAGGGDYATLTPDGADLARILRTQVGRIDPKRSAEGTQPERWQGLGPLICLALLPLGAVAFRRGWLLGPFLGLTLSQGLLVPGSAEALTWNDLWQRPDQQAAAALNQGEPEKALGLGSTPDQRGTASYRLKDYPSAAKAFGAADTADAAYNQGNALAQAGRLEDALGAYDQALARQPGMEDALYNRAKVEELLRQQKQQEQNQDQAQSGDQSPQDQEDQKDQGSEGQDQQGGEKDQQQAGSQDRQDQGEDQEAKSQDQQPGDREQQAQGQDQQSGGQEQQAEGQDQQVAGEEQDKGAQGQQEGKEQAAQDSGEPQDPSAQQAKDDKAAQDYRREAAQAGEAHKPSEKTDKAAAEADDLTPQEREAQQAADQWLRRIPDDPAGLLRRKFQYQYRQRTAGQGTLSSGNPW